MFRFESLVNKWSDIKRVKKLLEQKVFTNFDIDTLRKMLRFPAFLANVA